MGKMLELFIYFYFLVYITVGYIFTLIAATDEKEKTKQYHNESKIH